MGFWDRLLGRRDGENLPKLPEEVERADVDKLAVRTADGLVVVIVSPVGAARLLDAASGRRALRLDAGGRPLTIVPVDRETKIVIDPKSGWIVPVTPRQTELLLAGVRTEPGDYQVDGLGFAVVVED